MLEIQALGHGLDHQLAWRERGQVLDGLQPLDAGLSLLLRQTSLRGFFLKAVPRPLEPSLQRFRDRVVQQRARPRAGGELRDAVAHRARAQHPNGTCGCHLSWARVH